MKKSKQVIHWLEGIEIHRKLVLDKFADLQTEHAELKKRFDALVDDEAHFKENAQQRYELYDKMEDLYKDIRTIGKWLEHVSILLSPKIYMNRLLHTDITPWEVVEMCTPRKFIIREMCAKETEESKQRRIATFEPGGFIGHTDNYVQQWDIYPNEDQATQHDVIVRLHNDGYWYDTNGNQYEMSSTPRKFYDFNF